MKSFSDTPDAVFFDMDGLLVDTEPYWLEAERELMAEFGVIWRETDQLFCLGGPMEKVGRYMSELADGSEEPEWFAKELINRMANKFRKASLMPGIAALLDEISEFNIPSALVSASPRRLVDSVLLSVENHPFSLSLSADDVERGKPHPDPYLKAANLLQVDINNSLIIEDSPTGVAAARSSGAWVIAVPHIASIQEHEKSAIIASLEGHSLNSLWNLVRSR
ncbi:MAG: HAD family hydrolase [Actinomycetota bacterium]